MEYSKKEWGRIVRSSIDTKQDDLEKVFETSKIVYGNLQDLAEYLNQAIAKGKNKANLLSREILQLGEKQVIHLLYEHGGTLKEYKLNILFVGYKNTIYITAVDNRTKNSILPKVEEILDSYRM